MKITYEEENLRKNGVSQIEVQQVFGSDLTFAEDLEPSAVTIEQ